MHANKFISLIAAFKRLREWLNNLLVPEYMPKKPKKPSTSTPPDKKKSPSKCSTPKKSGTSNSAKSTASKAKRSSSCSAPKSTGSKPSTTATPSKRASSCSAPKSTGSKSSTTATPSKRASSSSAPKPSRSATPSKRASSCSAAKSSASKIPSTATPSKRARSSSAAKSTGSKGASHSTPSKTPSGNNSTASKPATRSNATASKKSSTSPATKSNPKKGKRRREIESSEDEDDDTEEYEPDFFQISSEQSESDDSDVDTTKNQIPRNYRRHKGKPVKRHKYIYRRWSKKKPENVRLHMSHLPSSKGLRIPEGQQMPGFCMLCPDKFYSGRLMLMIQHYNVVHFKNGAKIRNVIYLRCKCKDVTNRGLDNRTRNMHFHCVECFKPCDKASQLALHLLCKHNYQPDEINFLYDPKREKIGQLPLDT